MYFCIVNICMGVWVCHIWMSYMDVYLYVYTAPLLQFQQSIEILNHSMKIIYLR